jgi:hypothetical protein
MTTLLERPATPVPASTARTVSAFPAPLRVDTPPLGATWVVVTDPRTGRQHPELRWTVPA